MADEKKDDFFEYYKIVEVPEEKEEIKGGFKKTEKRISVQCNIIKNECTQNVKDYELKSLSEKARKNFNSLNQEEKDLLIEGYMKLGEALTFCRENTFNTTKNLQAYSKKFASLRNHIIHHYFYHKYHEKLGENEIIKLINSLPSMEELEKELNQLPLSQSEYISKNIMPGYNNFPFKFDHLIVCFEKEILELEKIEKYTEDQIKKNNSLKSKFTGHIRNIMSILLDMKSDRNTYEGEKNVKLEEIKKINEKFFTEKLSSFYELLNNNRNSLCHLDPCITKPYSDVTQMIEFAKDIIKLKEYEYILKLKACLEQKKTKIASSSATILKGLGYNDSAGEKQIKKREHENENDDDAKGEQEKQPNKKQRKEEIEGSLKEFLGNYGNSSDEDESVEDKNKGKEDNDKMAENENSSSKSSTLGIMGGNQ